MFYLAPRMIFSTGFRGIKTPWNGSNKGGSSPLSTVKKQTTPSVIIKTKNWGWRQIFYRPLPPKWELNMSFVKYCFLNFWIIKDFFHFYINLLKQSFVSKGTQFRNLFHKSEKCPGPVCKPNKCGKLCSEKLTKIQEQYTFMNLLHP